MAIEVLYSASAAVMLDRFLMKRGSQTLKSVLKDQLRLVNMLSVLTYFP